MPINLTFDSIGTGLRADLGNTDGESLFIGQEATVITTDFANAIFGNGDNQRVVIRGEVASASATTVQLSSDNISLSISDSGSVSNLGNGSTSRAAQMAGNGTSLTNAGTMTGNVGVYLFGQENSIVNTGLIEALSPTPVGTSVYAIRAWATGTVDPNLINVIENHGTLLSNFLAIDADAPTEMCF